MPIRNTKNLEGWKIVFVDFVERHTDLCLLGRFEITSPEGKSKSIRVKFSREFIDDYFRIPGDVNMKKNRAKILEEKRWLFKKWALIRIEELIDKSVDIDEPEIFSKDSDWAEKIEEGSVLPRSQEIISNTYLYVPEKRIGFK